LISSKAETFFSDSEKARISAAIEEVEAKTAGEIAVMVVDASDTYPEGGILAGVLLGGLLGLIVADRFFGESLWLFVPLAALLAVLIGWSSRFAPAVQRFFIPMRRLEERVQARALQAFYEEGLYLTPDGTAVLFFISLFEHKVWILADKGIYREIRPETLQAFAWDMAKGIRGHQAAEVLCSEIGKIGEVLAHHFPRRPDDTNELSNAVLTR
jgi:putative membrane protein